MLLNFRASTLRDVRKETVGVPPQEEEEKKGKLKKKKTQAKVSKKLSAFLFQRQTSTSTVSLGGDATPTKKAYILSDVTKTDGVSQKYANDLLLFPFSSERRVCC